MLRQTTTPVLLKILGIGNTLIQLFDIAIHVATDQTEPIRIASNIILIVWLVAVASGKIGAKFVQVAVGSIGGYLVLNIIFLMQEGITNPNQGGALRTMLFLLVFLTVALSTWLTARSLKVCVV